jgi:hypothetical protein
MTKTTPAAAAGNVPDDAAPAVPAVGSAFKGLLDDVARDVVVYIPKEVGDTIAGLVVANEAVMTEFGPRPASILDVNPADPSLPLVRFVWIDTVLQSAFERHRLGRGDQVAVRLTKRSGQTGVGDYNDWRVVVDKAPKAEPGNSDPTVRSLAAAAGAAKDPAEEPF